MALSYLTSTQVLEFLPLNTWTEVYLQPSHFKNVHFVSTYHKMEKRKKYMQSMSLESSFFDKVTKFEVLKIVAVEIEGELLRGKLISFNEFRTDNTIIQLIDYGNVYETKLENLFVLPYYFMYEPLALPVIFKDDIPKREIFSIKPLLSESNLHQGAVLVYVNYNDTELENGVKYTELENGVNDTELENGVNVKQLLESIKDIESTIGSKISVQNIITDHNGIESSLYLSSNSVISKEKLNNVPLKNEDYCILTYFEDFTCLYVGKAMKCGNYGSYSFVDSDTLINTAKSTDKILKYHPVVGDMVKVFSSQYDGLYRAKILKIINGSYDVFYIDFGNIETVPSNYIYELADELKKPGIAVEIGLSDFKDVQTAQEIKNMFQTFCDIGKPFVIEFDENSKNCLQNVKLKDIENGTYIDSKYIMKCTSIQTEESIQKPQNITEKETLLINSPELEVISNIELRTKKTNGSKKWLSGDHVEFLHGYNVDDIFVRNIKLYEEFKNVLDQLKGENSEKYKPVAVKAKDFVAVYSTKNNGGIHRARVMVSDVENANMIKCILIDVGQTDMIPPKHIFSLPYYVSLNNLPIMVRRVTLAGLNKILNLEIRPYLSSLRRKIYVMEYEEHPGEGNKQKVILKELESSVSLNDEIQKIFYNEFIPREIIS